MNSSPTRLGVVNHATSLVVIQGTLMGPPDVIYACVHIVGANFYT
jgi:hypothetical protein